MKASLMIELQIRCSVKEHTVQSARGTETALDIEAMSAAFVGCLRQIETAIEGRVDVPMLATSFILDMIGRQFKECCSVDGAIMKRRRELARVCQVLSQELATESEK